MTQPYPELGFMILGGHVHDPRPAISELKTGENLGLGSVWISERPGTKDIGALCGAAVGAAPNLEVGTGLISNLQIRNPLTVASFASTMAQLTDNRFILGVGHGQNRLSDMTGAPHSTMPLIGRYIETLRSLWRGETVTASHDGWTLNNAALGLSLDTLPRVFMGAVGDKTLAWAGRHADGVILFSCLNEQAVAHSVSIVRKAAEEAGRDPASVEIWGVAVAACEVDEEKFLNYIVRRMNTYFMLPMIDRLVKVNGWDTELANKIKTEVVEQAKSSQGALGDEGVSREIDELRRVRDLYPNEWLESCNAVGEADSACSYIRSLFDAGADKVLLHGSPPSDLNPLIHAWPQHRPSSAHQ